MQSDEIAKVLNYVADMLELSGENFFRVSAYHNAAQAIRDRHGDSAKTSGAISAAPEAPVPEKVVLQNQACFLVAFTTTTHSCALLPTAEGSAGHCPIFIIRNALQSGSA